MERLIDSYSEGAIDKKQFLPRLNRTRVVSRSSKREFTQMPKTLIVGNNYDFL